MATGPFELNSYVGRKPVVLTLLMALTVLLFMTVTGISHIFNSQQQSLAQRWSQRGAVDLKAQHYPAAVADFRTALLYDRDNYSFQLSLAQALLGLHRTDEAYTYLINLWDRQPENGLVNLELARIAAGKGDTWRAMRFYHNAIYATWSGDQDAESRNARFELIYYLLGIHANTQALAELIAIDANLDADSPLQEQLGELFLKAKDNQHALVAFRRALRQNRRNQAALAGAGVAAYGLARYPIAQRYLAEALVISPNDQNSAEWLHKTTSVLMLDPYRPQVRAVDRAHIAIHAFTVAGARLKSCTPSWGPAATAMQNLTKNWNSLKPHVNLSGLRRDPDLVNQAMDLAFSIERQASPVCGIGNDDDQALRLIANLHEEN
ncbi:MAG: tetratricopeptide repeat protein [Terracidiphilus sp.]